MISSVKTQTPIKSVSNGPDNKLIGSTASESLGKTTFHTHQISRNVKIPIPTDAENVRKLLEPHRRQAGHF